MEHHLEQAYKRDKRKTKALISPISKVDAEIIDNIVLIVDKLQLRDLSFILNQYKEISDKEILEQLVEFTNDIEEVKDKETFLKELIEVRDIILPAYQIRSMKKLTSYDNIRNMTQFQIIINEDETERILFHNTIISFDTEESRDREYKLIKNKLKKIGVTFL